MIYKALDFFNLDSMFSEEERRVRGTVRQYVDKEVMPVIADCWEEEKFPKKWTQGMAQGGLLGPFIPRNYGGSGCSYTIYGLICQELERGDSGVRSFASVQGSLVMYPIWKFGSEEQKAAYLPQLASGKMIGCFGLTEHGSGSDPKSMRTHAKKSGPDWILNGSKMWITNGSIADIAIVWAKDEKEKIRGFIVHKNDKGFSAPEIKHKVSLRASITSALFFDKVRIPAGRELPDTEDLKSPLMCLTSARYGIAWGAVGAMQAIFSEAQQYSLERIQFKKPIASFQLTQSKLADIATETTKAQLMVYQLGKLADSDQMKAYQVSMAKRNNVAMALKAAREARGILGANGITLNNQTIRHMCNLESVHTCEGTYEVHSLILGKRLTGISAFGNE